MPEPVGHALDGEVTNLSVPFVLLDLCRCIGQAVICRVQRVDLLELEFPPAGKAHRVVHFAPLQKLGENPKRRRPTTHTYRCTGFGQRLRDRKAEASVVRHAGDQGPLSGEINREHAMSSSGGSVERPHSSRNSCSGLRRTTSRLFARPTRVVSVTTPSASHPNPEKGREKLASKTKCASAHAASVANSKAGTEASRPRERYSARAIRKIWPRLAPRVRSSAASR